MFTLTPPTDPPLPSSSPPSSSHCTRHPLKETLNPPFFGTGRDVTQQDTVGVWGISPLRTKKIPIWTTIGSLHRGLHIHTSQFVQFPLNVHAASLYFSLHYVSLHCVDSPLAAYRPTSCKSKCFHTTSIRHNN